MTRLKGKHEAREGDWAADYAMRLEHLDASCGCWREDALITDYAIELEREIS